MSDPAPYVQANTTGRLHDARDPAFSPLDRGFLYGDAIYEVWRTYHGTVFAFAEHWARLEATARALHLALPFDAAAAFRELVRTAAAFRAHTGERGELYVRLQITRGAGRIGLDPALAERAAWVFLVQALPMPPVEKLRAGVRVATARNLRRNHPLTLDPAWKTGNYLNNLLALREARAAGADEVLFLNLDGELTEAANMNIAFVRAGTVLTPPLAAGILAGITRGLLLREIGPRTGVAVQEVPLRPADLADCTEAFFLSTTKDVTPIASLDGRLFTVGPNTVTARLKTAFADYARAYAAAHPEYRVAPTP
jgi:branched-chain amino acid aminotransferase